MCTAAGQKAASVELLDKANDKMNMQIGGVKWIAYLFFLDIFMTHRHVLWRHCSLIAPLPAAFCCYFIKIGCPAVVGARSGEEWRGPAGGRTFLALSVGADGEGAGCLSILIPFKHLPFLLPLAQILKVLTLLTHTSIAYFLSGQRGPKTNSPCSSVKV